MNGIPLSEAELARLYKMKAQGFTAIEIATALGRKYNTIVCRIKWDSLTPEQRVQRREQRREWNQRRATRMSSNDPKAPEPPIHRPTPEMIRDRDARAMLPYRDLTAVYLGDPPVGLSALEGRR